jgi:type I restriction enzyme S subunit
MVDSGWKSYRVENLIAAGALVVNDGYRAKNSELSDGGLPFARAGNVNNGFDFRKTARRMNPATSANPSKTSRTSTCKASTTT